MSTVESDTASQRIAALEAALSAVLKYCEVDWSIRRPGLRDWDYPVATEAVLTLHGAGTQALDIACEAARLRGMREERELIREALKDDSEALRKIR